MCFRLWLYGTPHGVYRSVQLLRYLVADIDDHEEGRFAGLAVSVSSDVAANDSPKRIV